MEAEGLSTRVIIRKDGYLFKYLMKISKKQGIKRDLALVFKVDITSVDYGKNLVRGSSIKQSDSRGGK